MPLIVRWPGKIETGAVSDVPVIGPDLCPTIAEIAGERALPVKVVDGKSLVPLLAINGEWDREDLYWYYPHYSPQAKQPGAAVRSGDYKLIEHYDPPGVELYNLAEDIGGKVDLASRMPDKAAELEKKIHDSLEATGRTRHIGCSFVASVSADEHGFLGNGRYNHSSNPCQKPVPIQKICCPEPRRSSSC